jgi:hypothetical protein
MENNVLMFFSYFLKIITLLPATSGDCVLTLLSLNDY